MVSFHFNVESLRFGAVHEHQEGPVRFERNPLPLTCTWSPFRVSSFPTQCFFNLVSTFKKKKKKSGSVFVLFCFQSQSCQNLFNHSQMSTAGSRRPLLSVNGSAVSHCLQSSIRYYTCGAFTTACSWNIHNNENCASEVGELVRLHLWIIFLQFFIPLM